MAKFPGWTKVAAGHYRHDETGIEIRRVDAHRENGYAVGVRWHLWDTLTHCRMFVAVGNVRTLRAAIEWADGKYGFIELRRIQIADAWDEAHAEQDERDHAEALAICASIPIDGRPSDVTALLAEAELKTDAHENLALVRQAHTLHLAVAQLRAWWDRHGLDKFTIVTAADILAARDADHDEALLEYAVRLVRP